MKKLVGFIFMLVLSLTLSMTAYAADDLGSIIAKVAIDKKKDKNKDKKKKKKKKVKKGKKNKKKAKKAKKGKKKVKKSEKDNQSNLKPSEVVEEVLDDYTSNEEEKKDLPVVELKVKSASKIWTNEVDVTKLNIEKTLNELLIGKNGYSTAPSEVVNFFNKYNNGSNETIVLKTSAGDTSNYVAVFTVPYGEFKFISVDSLANFKVSVKMNSDLNGYDVNDFLDKLQLVGLNISITQKQLDSVFNGESRVIFKAGSVFWNITGDRITISFERVEKNYVDFTMSDVFKACAKHRLVFTNNFYEKVSGLLGSDFVKNSSDFGSNYKYGKAIKFKFSKNMEGELGVDILSYVDNLEYRKTEFYIGGNVNIDTRVEELAKILDEYTGIDLYTFDTSRIENMLKGDAVQEFSVNLERDLGDSHVRISVFNNGEKTFQFSVMFTRKY